MKNFKKIMKLYFIEVSKYVQTMNVNKHGGRREYKLIYILK